MLEIGAWKDGGEGEGGDIVDMEGQEDGGEWEGRDIVEIKCWEERGG